MTTQDYKNATIQLRGFVSWSKGERLKRKRRISNIIFESFRRASFSINELGYVLKKLINGTTKGD